MHTLKLYMYNLYIYVIYFVTSTKTTKSIRFLKSKWQGKNYFPNPNRETKIIIIITQHVRSKNPAIFYCKEKTKTKQENVPKTNVEHIKSNGEFYFYYTHWTPISKKKFNKLPTHMWPMFSHVWPICKLWMNYDSNKSELRFN